MCRFWKVKLSKTFWISNMDYLFGDLNLKKYYYYLSSQKKLLIPFNKVMRDIWKTSIHMRYQNLLQISSMDLLIFIIKIEINVILKLFYKLICRYIFYFIERLKKTWLIKFSMTIKDEIPKKKNYINQRISLSWQKCFVSLHNRTF